MVGQPTVLILGAGASVDYGYPTGQELSNQIGELSYWSDMMSTFLASLHAAQKRKDFVRGFEDIRKHFFASQSLSIDAWLAKPDNSHCLDAGKLIIASLISRKEFRDFSNTGFFKDRRNKAQQSNQPKRNWYRWLFGEMTTKNLEDFGRANSKLSIITFNYDRSLEYYLLTAMQSMYIGRSEKECWEQLKLIPIIHVYGSVGELWIEWVDETGVLYGDTRMEMLMARAAGLRLIPEGRNEGSQSIDIIQNKIREAVHIFFIGFSYDETNLNLLGFPAESDHLPANICGSTYGLESGEIEKAKRITQIQKIN